MTHGDRREVTNTKPPTHSDQPTATGPQQPTHSEQERLTHNATYKATDQEYHAKSNRLTATKSNRPTMAHTKRPTHKATTLPTVFAAQYGYQAIMGLGCGLNLTILILLAPSVAGKKDVAVAIGAANQFRLLGGAISLGICTNILASKVKTDLSPVLSSEQLKAILLSFQSIEALGPAAQATVRTVYAEGYNLQMRVLIGISAAEVLATLMMWERKQSK